MESVSYYKILNVAHDATIEQINRAWRAAARQAHPDKHSGASKERIAELTALCQMVIQARKCLIDPIERRKYDAKCANTTFANENDPGNWFRRQREAEKAEERRRNERIARERERVRQERERQRREAEEKARREQEEREQEIRKAAERKMKEREQAKKEQEERQRLFSRLRSTDGVEGASRSRENQWQHTRTSTSSPSSTSSATPERNIPDASDAGSRSTANTTPQSSRLPTEEANARVPPHQSPLSATNRYPFIIPTGFSSRKWWTEDETKGLVELRKLYPKDSWNMTAARLNAQFGNGRNGNAADKKFRTLTPASLTPASSPAS
ncbi:hypothetical protein ABW19_dt0202884 [Dactylella cylindrospora]|nr:hypothetical protein ABW19_dt0202884 [Dactylella cylindrospora]